jgi:hypothetical protein
VTDDLPVNGVYRGGSDHQGWAGGWLVKRSAFSFTAFGFQLVRRSLRDAGARAKRDARSTTTADPPSIYRAPSKADILRGEYGRYRASNDLLYYHLDIRVDPDKKTVAAEHRPLQDSGRHAHRVGLYANLNVDKITMGDALKYCAISIVYIDFPQTLKADSPTRSISITRAPAEQGRLGGITFPQGSDGRRLDQHRLRGRGVEHLVAQQGSMARRAAGGHGDQRRRAQQPDRRVKRQVRRQDRSR